MTTHRSLNKLERRAHQNIHNTVEVIEPAPADGYTRDRFGKIQAVELPEEGARPRLVKLAALVLAAVCWAGADASAGSSTDVVVDSTQLGRDGFGDLPEPAERVVFYRDSDMAVDLNDSGDPNVNMRF